jgi:hypothetical protein
VTTHKQPPLSKSGYEFHPVSKRVEVTIASEKISLVIISGKTDTKPD